MRQSSFPLFFWENDQVDWWLVGPVGAAVLLGLLVALLPLPAAGLIIGLTAVLLLLLIQPLWGLALALVAGPLGAWEQNLLGNTLLDSGQLLLLATVGAWLGRGVLRRRIVIPATQLNGPLALFIGVTAVTLLDAPSLTFGLKELFKWIEIAVVMWLVVDLGRGRLALLVAIVLTAATSQALLGIWQFGLRGDGPEHFAILGGQFYRAFGTFQQPNPFGGYMGMAAALALGTAAGWTAALGQRWAAAAGDGRQRLTTVWLALWKMPGFWLLLAAFPAAVLAGLALIFSWSRGAWLGFAAALAVMAFFFPRKRRLGLALVLLGGAAFLVGSELQLIPASVMGRLNSFTADVRFSDVRGVDINDANYAVLERLAHWQAAVDMARDQLWSGVGFGNYEPAYGDYALINWPYPLGHAHNYYLNLLAETGLPGLLAYLLLWTAVAGQAVGLLRESSWPHRGVILGLLGLWTALAVHQLVDKLYVNNLYIFLGVTLGLLQSVRRDR